MKIIISPAKSLNFEDTLPISRYSQPQFLEQAEKINTVLKKKSANQLSKLMSISKNLGALNWQRNQDWHLPFTLDNARPAIYTFNGDVYQGLDVFSLPEDKIDAMQEKVRILSGLYGLLKPLDLIQAYRLEMGTKLKIRRKNNLYEIWGDTLTNALNEELGEDSFLLNLASNEYAKAINFKKVKSPVVTAQFKDYKNGQLKMIGFFAKKARGLMTRFILDQNIDQLDDVKKFDYEGYAFDHSLSTDNQFVFTR